MIIFLNSVCILLLVVYSHHLILLLIKLYEILSLIRNLIPNKASGSGGICGQMLLLCDNSVVLPLNIIFQNTLVSSIYPDMWKLANVIPIFKKGDKQLIKNYRPISLLTICGIIFENIIFNNIYNYLNPNNLITKINRVFVQVIPQIINYYILLMKSIRRSMTLNL